MVNLLTLLLSLPAIAMAAPIMEKGRDIAPQLRRDSLERAEASHAEARRRGLRDLLADAVRLDGYGTDCVAFDPAVNSCLVTVDEFDRAIEGRDFPIADAGPGFPDRGAVVRARGALLNDLLDGKFLSDYPLPAPIRDSLSGVFMKANSARLAAFRARQGDSALRALYRSHFASLFRGKEEKSYRVLASSDSLLADSLRESRPAAWGRFASDALPPELLAAARPLALGETAGPIRLPFGFAYLRFEAVRKARDVSFAEALPALVLMRQSAAEESARREGAIAGYYQAHRQEFMSPDTASFRIWLVPDILARARSASGKAIPLDTGRVRSRLLPQKELPAEVLARLAPLPLMAGRLLGPLRTSYGTWHLQVLGVRPGGRPLALEECRSAIARTLFGGLDWNPGTEAIQASRSKQEDLWKEIVGAYLAGRMSNSTAVGPAADPQARMEKEKREWMGERLVFRYVEPIGLRAEAEKPAAER